MPPGFKIGSIAYISCKGYPFTIRLKVENEQSFEMIVVEKEILIKECILLIVDIRPDKFLFLYGNELVSAPRHNFEFLNSFMKIEMP